MTHDKQLSVDLGWLLSFIVSLRCLAVFLSGANVCIAISATWAVLVVELLYHTLILWLRMQIAS